MVWFVFLRTQQKIISNIKKIYFNLFTEALKKCSKIKINRQKFEYNETQ